jgi:hypothetical protein
MNENNKHKNKLNSVFEDGVIMTQICVAMLASADIVDKRAISRYFKDKTTLDSLLEDCAKLNWQSQIIANINVLPSIKKEELTLIIDYIDIWRTEGKIKNYLTYVYKNKQMPDWQVKFENILLNIKNDEFNSLSSSLLSKLINCNLMLHNKSQVIENILKNTSEKFFTNTFKGLSNKIYLLQKTIQEEILLNDILFIKSLINKEGGVYSSELHEKLSLHNELADELKGSIISNDIEICVIPNGLEESGF